VPVVYEGLEVGSLELATDDRAFAERVATLISHHVARLETGGAAASLSLRPAFHPSKATAQGNPEESAQHFPRLSAPGARCRPRSGGRHSSCADLSPVLL
jgi:hypothetical protein